MATAAALTDERRITLIPVPNLKVVVLALAVDAHGLQVEHVPEVDPHEVAHVGQNGLEAGDGVRVLMGIHRREELFGLGYAHAEIPAHFFLQKRIPLFHSFAFLAFGQGQRAQKEHRQ